MTADWPLWLHDTMTGVRALAGVASFLAAAYTILWVLANKREPTSALAWCLLILLLPLLGPLLFLLLGYQNVHRPLEKKRAHRRHFRTMPTPLEATPGLALPLKLARRSDEIAPDEEQLWSGMGKIARRFDAFPVTRANRVDIYTSGDPAFAAKLEAIRSAKHHVHLEYFIVRPDETGRAFRDALIERAKAGVAVRLIYDSIGSHKLSQNFLAPLREAGGECHPFLPVSVLRHRFQVNLRNHRKILVVDGKVGFTGGLNIGDEYRGIVQRFGPWRDTHLRLVGPAAHSLQRIFLEDWDFASGKSVTGDDYFPEDGSSEADTRVQIVQSGPDQPFRSIREVYFAAFLRAQKRLWIASPYFVPDSSLLDALKLAAYLGVDVRLLTQFQPPDKWIPYYAARYYWADMLQAGVKIYQYKRGMMHAKIVLVDGEWASVGTANLDNRSMFLNFEVNALLYEPSAVARLESEFLTDIGESLQLEPHSYGQRPLPGRMLENVCRLASPVL